MTSNLTQEVIEIGKINFEGNIIPHAWYQNIKFENGATDVISIIILSEIINSKNKFINGFIQKTVESFANQFKFSIRQVKDSLVRLEKLGLIERDYRTIETEMGKIPYVLFIKIFPKRIHEISLPNVRQHDN